MVLIEAVVGITVGVLWGYVRQLDFFFTELYNICDNIPSTIILILISYVASPSIQTLILGMSLRAIAMARFIRNQILIIRDRDYNIASCCIGTPTSRIVVRNLLPYLVPSVIMLRMLTIPAAIGSEVFITYIGLGLSVEILAGQPHQRRPQGDDAGQAAVSSCPPHHHPQLCHHRVLSRRQRLLRRRRPEEPSAVRRDRRWKIN